jgi:hypothetical protein
MLQLLKESVSSRHSERLEQIVIVLIAIEISMFSNLLLIAILTLLLSSPWNRYYPCRPLCISYHTGQLDPHAYIHFFLLFIVRTFI